MMLLLLLLVGVLKYKVSGRAGRRRGGGGFAGDESTGFPVNNALVSMGRDGTGRWRHFT